MSDPVGGGPVITPLDFWAARHDSSRRAGWSTLPTFFAEEQAPRFTPTSRILDAACGQGQDSVYFARLGHQVTALDFAPGALASFADQARELGIRQVSRSLTETPYPFGDAAFDVVYSHLGIHYFDEPTTRAVLREFRRVLAPGGLLCLMVNSVDDPEHGEGTQLDDAFYELSPGDRKHYYSSTTLLAMVTGLFLPVFVGQHGRTRNDPHSAFVRLVAMRTRTSTRTLRKAREG